MGAAKFAISVPADTMKQVDRAAKRLKMTRSGYIAAVLARIASRERDARISKAVDDALTEIGTQDRTSAAHLRRARRDEGTEW